MNLFERIKYVFTNDVVDNVENKFIDNSKSKKNMTFDNLFNDDVDIYNASNISQVWNPGQPVATPGKSMIPAYRQVASYSYVKNAIDEICDTAIAFEEGDRDVVKLAFHSIYNTDDKLKRKCYEEFNNIKKLTDFENSGDQIFRDWYIDGKLLYAVNLDLKNITNGIENILKLDPLEYRKHYDPIEKKKYWVHSSIENTHISSYYGTFNANVIPEHFIIGIGSGEKDPTTRENVSNIHFALKDINRLNTLEDHLLIYRIVRSPQRRVFYIDAGNMPVKKAEAYLKQTMNTYSSKKMFDQNNGTMVSRSQHPSILEDFFLLRKNGKGTEIDTIGGDNSLGDLEDLIYFKKAVSRALKTPASRSLDESRTDSSYSAASTGVELSNEENKFYKFIFKLRRRFSKIFYELLKQQLIYKNIINISEWDELKKSLFFIFNTDAQFQEERRLQRLSKQMDILSDIGDYIGKYYLVEDVFKNVLNKTEEEINAFSLKKQEEKNKFPSFYSDEDTDF